MTGKLSKVQRSLIAEKLMVWGNLVFTGLVIAQFVPGAISFRWQFFFAGLAGIIAAYLTALFLMKGGD